MNYRNILHRQQLFSLCQSLYSKVRKLWGIDILLAFDLEKYGLENGVLLSGYGWDNIEKSTYIWSEYPCSVFEHPCSVSKRKSCDYPPWVWSWTICSLPSGRNQLITTVMPTKSDSDIIFCLQLLSKTLICTLHLSLCESIGHLCINPILQIGLIHKWSINSKFVITL